NAFFRIVPAGDSALIAELDDRVDPDVNARAIALATAVEHATITGVRDVVPGYRSVAVYFDPLRVDYDALVARLEDPASRALSSATASAASVRIPVCYGGTLGPDMAEVAAFARCSEAEVVALHTAATYRVFMVGFVAGFAYMGTVDARIAMPRHATPRVRV